MSVKVPAHQQRIFEKFPVYKPDPVTGFSRWPIPGMQGARHPFRDLPMASEAESRKYETTMGTDMARTMQRRREATAWNGEFTTEELNKPKRSEDESAQMKTMMPLPFDPLRGVRGRSSAQDA